MRLRFFLAPNFNRFGSRSQTSRSQTSALDDKDLDDARTDKTITTTCTDSTHAKRWVGVPHMGSAYRQYLAAGRVIYLVFVRCKFR